MRTLVKRFVWFLLPLGMMSFSMFTDIEQIAAALKKGSADELSVWFNNSLQLSTPSGEGFYSKAQAKMVMEKFFENNVPSGVTIVHQGTNPGGAGFAIIDLSTSGGDYRINIFLKKCGSAMRIQELKIEK